VVVVVGWLDIGGSLGIERFFAFCAKKKSLIFPHSQLIFDRVSRTYNRERIASLINAIGKT